MPKKQSAKPPGVDDRLKAYRQKRDRAVTVEPFSAAPTERIGSVAGPRFTVHLHAARRRHYDLRLEIGGVLVSFAVPKGPSTVPGDKRLAVRTEDHPLRYLDFEAVIPEGNYGAGAMIVWDQGTIHFLDPPPREGLREGKLDFVLRGHKLRGRFALIHTGARDEADTKHWLLLKKRDDEGPPPAPELLTERPHSVLSGYTVEQRAEAPAVLASCVADVEADAVPLRDLRALEVAPQLCATGPATEATLRDPARWYELKLDGVRIVADRRGASCSLRYRRRRPATAGFPEVVDALQRLALDHVVLDGELVAFDEEGKPNFSRLARRIHLQRPEDVARARREIPVVFLAFDLLAFEGRDVRALPLWRRKDLLRRLVPGRGPVRCLEHLEGDGPALFSFCQAQGLEGLVGKRRDAPYREGPRRTDDWLKVKLERETDLVVVGWDESDKASRRLRNLLLAAYDHEGELRLRGKVGSGLDGPTIEHLLGELAARDVASPPARGRLDQKAARRHWVRPDLVVNVRHAGFSERGMLRFPVFRGLRPDVAPEQCRLTPTAEVVADAPALAPDDRRPSPEPPARPAVAAARRTTLTNQTKVFWPALGATKGDLCDHYATVAPALLPWLQDRPVVMVRYPDGIDGKHFFQWNAPAGSPSWLRTVAADEAPRHKKMFILDDVDGLLYLANLGCVVLHAVAAREGRRDRCDFVTIDFDLPSSMRFADVVPLAFTLRGLLEEVGLRGYPKTSGQSGLHVLIPTATVPVPFEAARQLAELLGRLVVARHPDTATMERNVARRGQRVYVDTGQTGPSRTIVAPYSVRAVAGATVSTPLAWDEISAGLDPAAFDLTRVAARLARHSDPYADMFDAAVDLSSVLARLARFLG
ncbi:MAG: DNA ligase D [Myxococcota bacterium]